MNLSSFNKKELAIVEDFLQISNKINSIYEKLYELEIANKKESTEYYELIKSLKDAIKNEADKYQKANLTLEKKFKIIELLSTNPNSLKMDNIDSIINQNYNDKITRRIINILVNQAVVSIDYAKSTIPKEIFELLNELGFPIDDNQAYTDITNYSKIQLAINNDITTVFLVILQETLNLWKNSNYKNELIKALYSTSFINSNIESKIIENKFNISDNIYISSKLINDLLKTNPNIYNLIKTLVVEGQIRKHITDLLEIKDIEYNNPKTNITSIIKGCYIRALLTFLNDERIYTLNEQFHELIENPTYLIKHPKDRISEETIMNCFRNVKYDKPKKRIISFGFQQK